MTMSKQNSCFLHADANWLRFTHPCTVTQYLQKGVSPWTSTCILPSRPRIQVEYKIYLLAFLFIAIADKIGQIKIPFGLGTFILFPIFYP